MEDATNLKEAVQALQARLREEVRQRTELERRCLLLEKLAYRDPTTGLRTENYLRTRVQEEIQRSIRYPSATTLVTVCAPDETREVLPQLGMRLSEELRASDHIFRLDGTGLAILLVETPEEGARRVLDRIASDLEHFVRGYGFTVTSFPLDTNLADEFLPMAMERHHQVSRRLNPDSPNASSQTASVH
jgi:PleD family two-component response regulator